MLRPRVSEVAATVFALGVLAAGWGALRWSGTVRWALAGAGVAVAAVLVMWGLLGPGARWLSGERGRLSEAERSRLTVAERVESVNQARAALMQSVTGLVVIVGVVFTAAGLLYTARTLETTRQGQVTDRYTKAIEQLGSGKPEVRMGGVYALQRLMKDSQEDRRTIRSVLAAYVRTHAQDKPPTGSDKTRLAVDVEAALTVAASSQANGREPFDLRNADFHNRNLNAINLTDAILSGANLSHTNLSNATLSGANLSNANLSGANLSDANLSHTDLSDANLSGAELSYLDLSRADLSRADLSGTDLSPANLSRANLSRANLSAADLSHANLSNADLSHADLGYANLSGADLSGANLSGTNLSNAD